MQKSTREAKARQRWRSGMAGEEKEGAKMLFSKDARQSLYFSCFLPLLLSLAHRVACVTEGFSVCFFFCGSESKSYSCAKAEPRWKQKTTWGREREEKAVRKTACNFSHCLLSSSPPSSFSFSSSVQVSRG